MPGFAQLSLSFSLPSSRFTLKTFGLPSESVIATDHPSHCHCDLKGNKWLYFICDDKSTSLPRQVCSFFGNILILYREPWPSVLSISICRLECQKPWPLAVIKLWLLYKIKPNTQTCLKSKDPKFQKTQKKTKSSKYLTCRDQTRTESQDSSECQAPPNGHRAAAYPHRAPRGRRPDRRRNQ